MKFFVRTMLTMLFCMALAFAGMSSQQNLADAADPVDAAMSHIGYQDEVSYLLTHPADNVMLPVRNSLTSAVAKWNKTFSSRIRCEKRQLYRLIKSDNSHLSLDNKYHEINHLIGAVEQHLQNSSRRCSSRFLLTFNEIFRI